MRAASQPDTDALVDSYSAWRAACTSVQAAYEAWERSTPSQREAAFGGYLAALQREQHAAHLYQGRLEHLQRAA